MYMNWHDSFTQLIVLWSIVTALLVIAARVRRDLRRNKLAWLVIALYSFVTLYLIAICAVASLQGRFGVSRADAAPPVSFSSLDGRKIALAEFRGKPVLVEFWASWCRTCREIRPGVAELERKYAQRGLVVLAVNLDGDESNWRREVARNVQPGVQVRDAEMVSPLAFRFRQIPVLYLIDRDGVVRFEQHGWTPPTYLQLAYHINKALQ